MDGRQRWCVLGCWDCLFFPFLVFLFLGLVGERGTVLGLDLGQVPGKGEAVVCIPLSLPTAAACYSTSLSHSYSYSLSPVSLCLPPSPSLSPVSTSLSFPPLCSLFLSVLNDCGARGEGRERRKGNKGYRITPGLDQDWTMTGNTYYAAMRLFRGRAGKADAYIPSSEILCLLACLPGDALLVCLSGLGERIFRMGGALS